jgi:arginine deiminase
MEGVGMSEGSQVSETCGVNSEVGKLRKVLTETVDIPIARAWLLDRKITANEVGLGLVEDSRAI